MRGHRESVAIAEAEVAKAERAGLRGARPELSFLGLLVVADAAVDIADLRDEADLLHGLRFAGAREHVADLRDRTFRLLPGVIDFLTKKACRICPSGSFHPYR
jgi:hypothetical protein